LKAEKENAAIRGAEPTLSGTAATEDRQKTFDQEIQKLPIGDAMIKILHKQKGIE